MTIGVTLTSFTGRVQLPKDANAEKAANAMRGLPGITTALAHTEGVKFTATDDPENMATAISELLEELLDVEVPEGYGVLYENVDETDQTADSDTYSASVLTHFEELSLAEMAYAVAEAAAEHLTDSGVSQVSFMTADGHEITISMP